MLKEQLRDLYQTLSALEAAYLTNKIVFFRPIGQQAAASHALNEPGVYTVLAPGSNRYVVLDPDAEANALTMSPFLKADERGDQGGILAGQIGTKLGFQWWLDQNVPTHTAGVITDTNTGSPATCLVAVATAVGAESLTMAYSATNTGSLKVGDLFTIENNTTQQFVVTAAVSTTTIANNSTVTVAFAPALTVAASVTNKITWVAAHVNNMLFHRDAFAFASRPLMTASDPGLGSIFQSAIDPVSGLALRLEVSRQNKMQTWSFDILYGGTVVRPQLAARLLG